MEAFETLYFLNKDCWRALSTEFDKKRLRLITLMFVLLGAQFINDCFTCSSQEILDISKHCFEQQHCHFKNEVLLEVIEAIALKGTGKIVILLHQQEKLVLSFMVGVPITSLKGLAYGQSKLLAFCCFMKHIHSKSVHCTSAERTQPILFLFFNCLPVTL